MAHKHPAVAALPVAGQASKTLTRNMAVAKFPYVIEDDEDFTDFDAIDPDTGAVTIDVMLFGRTFHYDPTDTLTGPDGVTCLVSADGLRYKLNEGSDVFAYSVLDNTIATPPVSPTIGDAYLVASGATGAWAGHADDIAHFGRRGWEFIEFDIGRFIYVESVDTYYHRNSGGAWVTGFGNHTFTSNTIPLSSAINFGKRLIVENQTTNAPPGSPSTGDGYIIGPSPTGAWAGKALKIAICEDGSTFTIYTATNGWSAYDKALNNSYTFDGSTWSSSTGAILRYRRIFDTSPATTAGGSGNFGISATSAPTTEVAVTDSIGITWSAKTAGALLEFTYQAYCGISASDLFTAALMVDSVSAAADWQTLALTKSGPLANFNVSLWVTAADTLPHTYKFRMYNSPTNVGISSISRRTFTLKEIPA